MNESLRPTRSYKVLVFTSWYPTPESPSSVTFTQQQVELIARTCNSKPNETWKFTVWHQAFETDWPNRILRNKYRPPFTWSNDLIRVFFNQSCILSHRLPIDQDILMLPGMKLVWKDVVKELGGVPDVVWCITLTGLIQASWFLEKMNLEIPTFLQEHSVPLEMHTPNEFRKIKATKYLANARSIIAVAERQREEFLNLTDKKVDVLWNCVDAVFFEREATNEVENKIIFVGRFSEQKGIIRLLKAFQQFVLINPAWKLNLIGDGEQFNEIKEFIKRHGMEKNILLCGLLSKEKIVNELRKASFFVLPSFYENCPVSLLEAQAIGVPCLVTINGASEKVLLNGNGIAVNDSGDGSELYKGMIKMQERVGQFQRSEIQKRAYESFSPEVFSAKFLEIMSTVLHKAE